MLSVRPWPEPAREGDGRGVMSSSSSGGGFLDGKTIDNGDLT